MSKNMIIMSNADKEKIEQLIEEDLITYCDNVVNMVENPENYEMIINMSKLLIEDLTSVELNEITKFLNKIMDGIQKSDLDLVKTEILLCRNYVMSLEVIYT